MHSIIISTTTDYSFKKQKVFVFAAAAAGKKGKGNRLFEFSDLQSDTFLLLLLGGAYLFILRRNFVLHDVKARVNAA